jgi:membrane protein DedA with SNARE-associated domain
MDFTQLVLAWPWGVYLLIAITPFIQEDTAVIGAATASISGANPLACYLLLVLGITGSDLFKYGIGRLSHAFDWTRRMTRQPAVRAARERILNRLGLTLVIARFVPGTRIPLFIASGLFRAPLGRAAAWITGTAFVYAGAIFVVFHALGAAMGEEVRRLLPLLALGIVLVVIATQFIRAARMLVSPAVEPGAGRAYVVKAQEDD